MKAAAVPANFTGRMPVVCMECKDEYDAKPCAPEQDGAVSHGYCPACFPGVMQKLLSDSRIPPRSGS